MITELKITGFRGFKDFSLRNLGRVNLLVGSNNGGKTSVLEAVNFFASRGEPMTLYNAMMRRGECKWLDSEPEIDIRHLFYGYETQLGSQFSISGKRIDSTDILRAAIQERDDYDDDDEFLSPYILKLTLNDVEVRDRPKWFELRLNDQK